MGHIGTHSGTFHCDEVLACYLLKTLPEFHGFDIFRTRDSELLAKCDVVVDVGGEYDHTKLRYDHHQRDFSCTMRSLRILNFDTKLSSAGLVYAHYGKNVISHLLSLEEEDPTIDVLYKKLYESFVESVDAIDNGIAQCDCTPRYRLHGTLSGRVSHLNPAWNETNVDVDKRFSDAMELVGNEFVSALNYLYMTWLPAKNIVAKAFEERFEVDESGKMILLPNGGVPWKEHLFALEKELEVSGLVYTIFQDKLSETWRVQAIPIDEHSAFENRLPLPMMWRGLRDEELSEAADIPGCVFVHSTGFIGGNQTRDGAIEMGRKSLKIASLVN